MSRPLKYGEPTKTIGFKVPLSKEKELKEATSKFIDVYLNAYKSIIENRKVDCGCIIENGLLKRDKNSKCKLTKSEH